MKYFKRLKVYKAKNVVFNPEKTTAHSYSWWCFVKIIDGLVVFNNYRYSVTTVKHQTKVRSLLSELGIKIDLVVNTRESLNEQTINELIVETEERLCYEFLKIKERNISAYERAKTKRPSLVEQVINNSYKTDQNETIGGI